MNAHALHLPEERGLARWLLAAVAILIVHGAIIAAILWHGRKAAEPALLPAIAVTLAPMQSSAPDIQHEDTAVGPAMQQADETPRQPPKAEERPAEQVMQPTPPQQAEVALPTVEQKVEQPKPATMPPAPETRAPPRNERAAEFTEAGSNAYDALVLGHLRRYHRYPRTARGASGKVIVAFVLDRAGHVLESVVKSSSGNRVLDQEALETLQRANPFPPFPAAKPGNQCTYVVPLSFSQSN
jgi:protein TonB